MNVFDVYAADAPTIRIMRQAIAGEEVHGFAGGHGMHWETWCTPVRGSDGNVELVAGLTLNITERRKAEEELRARLMQIDKQQEVIRSLSTPIIEVWDGVLTLPLVGVVDSTRTGEVMDALLARISDTQARFAILDLTGVDMVDSRVAGHVVGLVAAIRLLGAEGIVAGIKPNVAQAMVALGLDLSQIPTQRNLRAALAFCLRRMDAAPG
jgi:rsbT co-antagonist protein RsbR